MTPERRILHCDMDCFYAAVHVRDDPSLRGKPVVVGGSPSGRGVIAAASYEARAFGVHSAMPAARAVRLCPQAVFIRPDFGRYTAESKAIFAIYARFTDRIQPASLDEAYLDVTERLDPWGSATAIAREIRRLVLEERRLTVSVGVGPNKLVAKIASDFRKPDGLTVVRPERVEEFLAPLPVRRLHGVGPATERVLLELGIEKVGDLRRIDPELLRQRFGRHGPLLQRYAWGQDDRGVETDRVRKSLGSETTFALDLEGLEAIEGALAPLADDIAQGLAKRELATRGVSLKVRYRGFETVTRALSLRSPVADAETLLALARRLLQRTDAAQRPVRLLGITATQLVSRDGPRQLDLFSTLTADDLSGATMEEP